MTQPLCLCKCAEIHGPIACVSAFRFRACTLADPPPSCKNGSVVRYRATGSPAHCSLDLAQEPGVDLVCECRPNGQFVLDLSRSASLDDQR